LDILVLERGLLPTREITRSFILRGDVLVGDQPITKAGQLVRNDAQIRVRGELPRFVGRGGEKLEGALEDLQISVEGAVALDVGASTGGFTDCLLQRGARLVYAVDVGHAQLAESLRQNPKVVVFEGLHAKDLKRELFPELPQLATVDLSFIGLQKVLPAIASALSAPWRILALVKPQFELGPEFVEKGGLVRKEADQLLAVERVAEFARAQGWSSKGHSRSRLTGAKSGNQESFLLMTSGEKV